MKKPEQFIQQSEKSLRTALADPTILAALKKHGYTKQKIEEILKLCLKSKELNESVKANSLKHFNLN